MKNKLVLIFIASLFLLFGCTDANDPTEKPTSSDITAERPLFQTLFRLTEKYSERCDYTNQNRYHTVEDWYEDEDLQSIVADFDVTYPLRTEEQILTYAWAFYDVCMERELFDPEYIPNSAMYFSDEIWQISYMYPTSMWTFSEKPSPYLLISAEDGHIISFFIE